MGKQQFLGYPLIIRVISKDLIIITNNLKVYVSN